MGHIHECYIRGLFESHDEIDVAFKEMKIRNFDPYSISKMARKMMFEQHADKKTLAKKISCHLIHLALL